jgi:hypothetical protein
MAGAREVASALKPTAPAPAPWMANLDKIQEIKASLGQGSAAAVPEQEAWIDELKKLVKTSHEQHPGPIEKKGLGALGEKLAPVMGEEYINKKLAESPGASIFDIAGAGKGLEAKPAQAGDLPTPKPGDWWAGKSIPGIESALASARNLEEHNKLVDKLPFSIYDKINWKAAQFDPHNPENIAKHLKEIDWSKYKPEGTGHALEEPDVAEHIIQGLGFNPKVPLYKGGGSNLYRESMPDPSTKHLERGLFFSHDPEVAEKYGSAGVPLQYVSRATKAAEVNWKDVAGSQWYEDAPMHSLIEAARQKGYDMVVVKGLRDIGGMQDQYVVTNPALIRAPHAKFDPTKLDINNIFAGLAGGGIALPAAMQQVYGK